MTVLGTETEYGILAPLAPELHPAVLSAAVVAGYPGAGTRAELDWFGPIPIEDAHNRFLGNGARLYVDHAHPEYSTPETTTAWAALRADLAGDDVVRAGARAASAALGVEVRLFKNNTDGKGASYGYHENYLLRRATPWADVVAAFLPYLVTRIPLVGAGRVGLEQDGRVAGFQISQRADFFEAEVGIETTVRRPLVNTRDEPHATPSRWRRLHVIAGDANRCHTSTLLKLGSAQAVAAAVDAGAVRPVRLAAPLAAVRTISRDLGCRATVELADGRRWTALDVQEDLVAQLRAWGGAEAELLVRWQELIDQLRVEVAGAADRLDWVAKLEVLRRVADRDALGWSAPRLAQIDLAYADLDPERSVYAALVRGGALRELVSAGEIAAAVEQPPVDTRAYLRGRLIADHPAAVEAADWSAITLRTGSGTVALGLPEPLAHTRDDVAADLALGGGIDAVVRRLTR